MTIEPSTLQAPRPPEGSPGASIPLGISGPYDGVVEIFSSLSSGPFLLPIRHIDLLIEILSTLDRTERVLDEVATEIVDEAAYPELDERTTAMLDAAFIWGFCGPYDGEVDIFLPAQQEALSLLVSDIDTLIDLLSHLERDGKQPERFSHDVSS